MKLSDLIKRAVATITILFALWTVLRFPFYLYTQQLVASKLRDIGEASGFSSDIMIWAMGLPSWVIAMVFAGPAFGRLLRYAILGFPRGVDGIVEGGMVILVSFVLQFMPDAIRDLRNVDKTGKVLRLVQVDPAKILWFRNDGTTARIFYSREEDRSLRFWNKQANNTEDTGAKILPVTVEIRKEYDEGVRHAADDERKRSFWYWLSHRSGSDTPQQTPEVSVQAKQKTLNSKLPSMGVAREQPTPMPGFYLRPTPSEFSGAQRRSRERDVENAASASVPIYIPAPTPYPRLIPRTIPYPPARGYSPPRVVPPPRRYVRPPVIFRPTVVPRIRIVPPVRMLPMRYPSARIIVRPQMRHRCFHH
jgi:hypothetical protein